MKLVSPMILMHSRLYELGLQAIDVGGAGDCCFRSVSHQLYGNNNHHMRVRSAGVQYMRDQPERFAESNTQNSWLRYLIIIWVFTVHKLMHLLFKLSQMH